MNKLREIIALAEKATPGPWEWDKEYAGDVYDSEAVKLVVVDAWPHDAAFIAAADPDTVKALVRVARAASRLDEMDEPCTCGSRPEEPCGYCGPFMALREALAALPVEASHD